MTDLGHEIRPVLPVGPEKIADEDCNELGTYGCSQLSFNQLEYSLPKNQH